MSAIDRIHLASKAFPRPFQAMKTHKKRLQHALQAMMFFVRSGKEFYFAAIALTRAVMRETLREPVFL